MRHLALEDFTHDGEQMDSLYRLVNIAARRANQLGKPDSRSLVSTSSRKAVIQAIEEVLDGKIWYSTGAEGESDFEIG